MANRLHQPHVPLPEIHWSPNEQWVWRKLRRGEVADFNERYGVELVAWEEEAWNEEEKARRLIRPEFLYTVLLHEPWRSVLSNWGVQIGGAYFADPIEMPFAEVKHEFWLSGCRIEGSLLLYNAHFAHRLVLEGCSVNEANFQGLCTDGNLIFDQSWVGETDLKDGHIGGDLTAHLTIFMGLLAMDRCEIKGGLFMRESRLKGEARLRGSRVSGPVAMEKAFLEGHLGLDGAIVQSGLFMTGGHFKKNVDLLGMRISVQVYMVGATFAGRLRMDSADVLGDLIMRGSIFKKDVRLGGLRVGGQMTIEGACFSGKLVLDGANIHDALLMNKGTFQGEVRLVGVNIGGQLTMNGSRFSRELLVQGAVIKDALLIRGTKCTYFNPTRIISTDIGTNLFIEESQFVALDLTGTSAQAVVDNKTRWPDKLKLDHFTYQHLGGLGEGYGGDHMLDRPASWFTGWLAKHKPYSSQPYEQCAKVLREAGQPGKAKEVLYQGKERERNEPNGDFRRWVWLTASKWLLGHGLTWRFAVVPAAWAVGVLLLGWLIFCQTPCLSIDHSAWWGLGYSLSKLIPLVSFGKDLADLHIEAFGARLWFTFETLFGWFLASLIVAGLAGVGRPGGKS